MFTLSQLDFGIETNRLGDFEVRKAFSVRTMNGKAKGVNGLIIQYIQRATSTIYKGVTLTTNAQLERFTSNLVMNANGKYFELFTVVDGESVFADSFASGAVTAYDKHGYPDITLDTKGSIKVQSSSIFICDKSSLYEELKSMPWSECEDTPANGLPYLPETFTDCFKTYLKKIKTNVGSNCYYSNNVKHVVSATWSGPNKDTAIKSRFL